MKEKIYFLLLFSCFISTSVNVAQAQTGGCSSVINLPDSRFIYKNSAPVRANSAITAPIIGFRVEPTLIMYRAAFSSRSGTVITDSAGNAIGKCPWASAREAAGGRFRCTMNTRNLRRAALRNTKSPAVFIRYRGNECVKVPDAGRCYGSVKGPCNQILG